jgi:aryl-alcohol dehydrogenase-like predicted oxidoreductase
MYQTKLRTSRLGDTGLEVTRVGFGAWAIGGGGWEAAAGLELTDEDVSEITHAAEGR